MISSEITQTGYEEILRLKNELQFLHLLAEVSTHFINMPMEQIDDEIESSLQKFCEFLHIDQATLWQPLAADEDDFFLTHSYNIPEGPDLPVDRVTSASMFPWLMNRILNGVTCAHRTEDLPKEADIDKKTYRHYGVKSSIVVPLRLGEKTIGSLGFDSLTDQTDWSDSQVKQIQQISQIYTNSIFRKSREYDLIEKKERFDLITNAAGTGLWILDFESGDVWSTPKFNELLEFDPVEKLNYSMLLKNIYFEDIEQTKQVFHNAYTFRVDFRVDFRVPLQEGNFRYILSIGKYFSDSKSKRKRLMGVSIDVSHQKQLEEDLKNQLTEIEELKGRLENENLYLRKEQKQSGNLKGIVGESNAFKSMMLSAEQVASTDATVLLSGETGTGKSILAIAIQQLSVRKNRPLVTVNCLALPKNLIESELFGREKGAFTGADSKQVGRFEVADGGTIFLDEIGEMPMELQSKLLHVLQEGRFERLGSTKTIKVDVRIIAATNRDLKNEIREGRFREDLFYRINVFPITLPPLRQRTDDIAPLVHFFVEKYCQKMNKKIDSIPNEVMKQFVAYNWPGNVRELEHVIERSVITSSGPTLQVPCQLISDAMDETKSSSLLDLETLVREHILKVLQETDWKISGSSGAASILKLHPNTLRFRMQKLNIYRPK